MELLGQSTANNGVPAEQDVSSMDGLIRPFNSLSDLLMQPSVLSSESSLLTSELTSLCHTSYPTFLLLHNASNTLSSSLSSLSSSLDSLISTVPSLHTATQHFSQTTRPILEERRKASLILDQQDKLIDLLEIPTLIDTCARNGQYQDAYELSLHAANLWDKFPQVSVVSALKKEVEGSVRLMLSSLMETLKSKAKLPALFKAVGYLRKMGTWNEEDLAILFLCCRGHYIDALYAANAVSHGRVTVGTMENGSGAGTMEEGKALDTARYLRGKIDIYREGVYDTLAAYTTIFLDHNRSSPPALLSDLRHLLSVFTHQHTKALISTLNSHLPTVSDFTSLSSLLTQLNYCATSFARVGLDFRPLLQPPFEGSVVKNIGILFENAAETFVDDIVNSEQAAILPSKWLVTAPATPTSPFKLPNIPDFLNANQSFSQPPQILTFSPLLATLLNAYMSALNALRLLPILSALPEIHALLCVSLTKTMRALLDYCRLITSPASPTTRVSFERHRSSISLERRGSLPGVGTPRPMSPAQRAGTPTSARPFSPTPRQSFTANDDIKSKQEMEKDVVLTVGKAHSRILVPFSRRALIAAVYGIEVETFTANTLKREGSGENKALTDLESTINEWEGWFEEWKPKSQDLNGDNSKDNSP